MWLDIPIHFDYVGLDEFIIMPNHIHGIVLIYPVGDRHACPLQRRRSNQALPTIIGSFKSSVTQAINSLDYVLNF